MGAPRWTTTWWRTADQVGPARPPARPRSGQAAAAAVLLTGVATDSKRSRLRYADGEMS
jgi:hypothetical protein